MNRKIFLEQLRAHQPFDRRETEMRQAIERFVLEHERFHDRALSVGHLTGSAWILDQERTHALLTHHRKLNLWVQLGGHVENDADMLRAAWREAREESGLTEVQSIHDRIFDVDIHEIPERRGEPKHFHYDIRFVFSADRNSHLTISGESRNLAWVALEQIPELTQEESILRMIRKTKRLNQYREP
ncbi:MAG: NUDIX hydrolase [Blastocatellia bacterium]